MKKTRIGYILAMSVLVCFSGASGGEPERMSAGALLKLAPRISLNEKDILSFEISGTLDLNGITLRFELFGEKPDKLATRIVDPRDGTPILIGMGDTSILYDSMTSEILLSNCFSWFTLQIVKGPQYKNADNPDGRMAMLYFGFNSAAKKKEDEKDGKEKAEAYTTVIDIRSFLDVANKPLDLKTEDGKNYILTGLSDRGSRSKAFISPSRKGCPYTRFELYEAGKKSPFLVLDKIVVNKPIPKDRFVFPKKALLASPLPVKEVAMDGQFKTIMSMGRLIKALMVRLALNGFDDVELKKTLGKMVGKPIDWDMLKKKDRKVASLLRKVFEADKTKAKGNEQPEATPEVR